jgi:hypothetical protein
MCPLILIDFTRPSVVVVSKSIETGILYLPSTIAQCYRWMDSASVAHCFLCILIWIWDARLQVVTKVFADASGLSETSRCVVGWVVADLSKAHSAFSLRVNLSKKTRRHIAADVRIVWDIVSSVLTNEWRRKYTQIRAMKLYEDAERNGGRSVMLTTDLYLVPNISIHVSVRHLFLQALMLWRSDACAMMAELKFL